MNNQKAVLIDWPVTWGSSVYTPAVISDGDKLLLVFKIYQISSVYEKSTLKIIEISSKNSYVVIIEFLGWVDFKFGKISEDFIADPSYISGLQPYRAYEVVNSEWLNQLKQIISTSQGSWDKRHHFVLGFHDTRFECIANSYYVEAYPSGKDVIGIAYERVFGD